MKDKMRVKWGGVVSEHQEPSDLLGFIGGKNTCTVTNCEKYVYLVVCVCVCPFYLSPATTT
ncbi:hypothetical protein U0070_013681, partial [Myodes glareolus]